MYRLIIADDEENIRNGMANSLPWREWGYEVAAVCASGQEVLDRMEDCRPDVVLSDIRMPGMDGVELMQRLSREYPQVKIVILSGYSDFKYLNMSIRSHVAEYLLKPTDIDDFEETFRRLKAAMDHERLRRAQITESVLRHFHVWLTAMLGGVATPEDTDRFLPMLTEAGIDLDNLQVAAFVLDGHGGDERPDQVALWRRVWEVTAALPAGPLRRLSFLLGGEDMVVLYSSGEEIAPGDVRADIEAIQRAVRDGLRVTLSAGVSDLCTEPGMLPQAYEQANCSAKQSAFAGQEAVYFFSQMQKERPAGMPYFDTEQVEKALLAQDYDALRAEIDRVLLPLAESLPEYRAVDQLCLSLLFHVSLWGLRYGIQMEEVLRALGAHYTDVYQSETLAAKRDFVLACLFGCQQALAARRRSHSHAVKSVAMRVREYVDAEYCSNNNALFESYSRLVRQERIGAIYMPARREVLDFRDPNQVTTLLVKRFEALDVANPDKLGRFFFYPLQKNFLSTETYGEPRRDMVVLGSRRVYSALKSGYPYVHIFAIEEQDIYDLYQYQARRMGAAVYVLTEEGELISSTDEAAVAAGQAPAALLENAAALDAGTDIVTLNGERYNAAAEVCHSTDWKVLVLVPNRELMASALSLYVQILGVVLFCLAVFALLIWHFYRRFMDPLARLEQAMRQADAGDLKAYVKPQGPAEVVRMMEGYNAMLDSLRTRVAAWRRGEKLLLTVTDNGVGMDRAALARLRDQIVHGRKPRAEANYRSTGIGLHNIGARLRLYAGSSSCIRVQSKPQFGTRVTLELPWRAIGTES